jgi:hypothetical protein
LEPARQNEGYLSLFPFVFLFENLKIMINIVFFKKFILKYIKIIFLKNIYFQPIKTIKNIK